jgi:hypothetical protein
MAVSSTSFKEGNQAAAGSSYDLDEEARQLDAWSKLDDSLTLAQFCVFRDTYPQRVYEWIEKSGPFAEAFNKAKIRIATRQHQRLHDKDKPYNYGLYMRMHGFYDSFANSYENAEKDKDAKRALAVQEAKDESLSLSMGKAVLDSLDKFKAGDAIKSSNIDSDSNSAESQS